jgi:hypothetical protein
MTSLLRYVDDFYPEPDLVREIALRSTYFVPEGLYGHRSTKGCLPRGTIEKIKSAFGFAKIRLTKTEHSTSHFYHCLAHGSQRTTFCAHIDGARSRRNPRFSMVVYLSRRAPKASGTGVYRHRRTGIWQEPTAADANRLGQSADALETLLENEALLRARWELLDSSEHVYNRAVLFPAHWYHSSCCDFGSRLETGRLYQAFFFCGYPDVFSGDREAQILSSSAAAAAAEAR